MYLIYNLSLYTLIFVNSEEVHTVIFCFCQALSEFVIVDVLF